MALNFNQATEKTQKRFISVAKHYVERINNDNLKQDFQSAIQQELEDVKSQTQNLVKEFQNHQSDLQKAHDDYKKTLDERNRLTKGITAMFFIVALVMITFVVLSPLGDLLGVQHFYDWINHVLKTGHSPWRYLIVMFYFVPYILFSLLIYAIFKAYERL